MMFTSCPRVSVAVIKYTMTKATWRGKGSFQLTLSGISPWLREVRTGTQARQETWGRSWCRAHGRISLTCLLYKAFSACFLSFLFCLNFYSSLVHYSWNAVSLPSIPFSLPAQMNSSCFCSGLDSRPLGGYPLSMDIHVWSQIYHSVIIPNYKHLKCPLAIKWTEYEIFIKCTT